MANGGRPWKREKERGRGAFMRKGVEFWIFWRGRYFGKLVEGKKERKRKKGKGKEFVKEKNFEK